MKPLNIYHSFLSEIFISWQDKHTYSCWLLLFLLLLQPHCLSYMCTLRHRNALRGISFSFRSLMSVSFVKVMWILLPYRKFCVISSGKRKFRAKKNVTKTKLYFLMSHVSNETENVLRVAKSLSLHYLFVSRSFHEQKNEWKCLLVLFFYCL